MIVTLKELKKILSYRPEKDISFFKWYMRSNYINSYGYDLVLKHIRTKKVSKPGKPFHIGTVLAPHSNF